MAGIEKVIFMNMCMVYDDKGNVLALDKVGKSYSGTTFPGGHVEQGETFTDSVIREVYEETGLRIKNPILKGVYHWIIDDVRNVEKIDNEKVLPHPEEVLVMSEKYKSPELCNYYCANQCPIGQQYVPEIKMKELPQIILETVASLNKKQERLIEITADGIIDDDELDDFIYIHGVMKYAKEFGIGD